MGDFWEEIIEQLKDLVLALVILFKEAFFGLAVLGVSRLVAYLIHQFSENGDRTAAAVTVLGEIGAVVLFVFLLIKDLKAYYRRK